MVRLSLTVVEAKLLRAYPNNPVYFWYEYNNDNQAHARAHAQ